MDSVERVRQICKSKKIPISKLEKDLGYSNGYISQLRKGVFPSDRLISIAEYLGVSTNYLMTGKDDSQVDGNPYGGLKGIYLSYAKEAQENGIDPDDIRLALETIRKLRGDK